MKIRKVALNNRRRQIEATVRSGKTYAMPFAKLDPRPTPKNPVVRAFVDPELGKEAITYVLASGKEGSVHIDHLLEYAQDPSHLAELLVHRLSVEAMRRANSSGLSRRELARRLGTSVPQLYRLLDPANTKKRMTQLISLLHILGFNVDLVVRPRSAA